MKKIFLLTFLGASCFVAPPEEPDPVPGMGLDPETKSYSYDANPGGTDSFVVTVSNTGDNAFDWEAFPEDVWLSCDPAAGSLQEDESVDLTVTVDFTQLTDVMNASDVRIEWSGGADRFAHVSVYVAGGLGWIVVDGVNGDETGLGTVASPYKTIAQGLAAAGSGDTVVCLPATYEETVVLEEGIDLVGSGPQGCLIDAGTGPSVTVSASITNATNLSGFSVTGDDPPDNEGAAMSCEGSPAVSDCEFVSCQASGSAAVLFKGDSGATLTDCSMSLNSAFGVACLDGSHPVISHAEISSNLYSGVRCAGSSYPVIEFCEIASNDYPGIDAVGSSQVVIDANIIRQNVQGVALWDSSSAVVTNNVIRDSTGSSEGAGYGLASALGSTADATLTNNTIVGNEEGIWWGSDNSWTLENNIIYYSSTAELSSNVLPSPYAYNCIEGHETGGENNIGVSPWFENYDERDLRLKAASPCRNSGNDGAISLPTLDRAGNARIMGVQVDRGAYEYVE